MDQSVYLIMLILTTFLFVAIENTLGLKKALTSALIMVAIWLALTYWMFGAIDELTALEVFFILLMAGFSWWKRKDVWFKLQPAIFGFIMAGITLISGAIGKPILLEMSIKYMPKMSEEGALLIANPKFIEILREYNFWAGISFILHALLIIWAARRWSNWGWATARIVGFYGLQILALLVSVAMVGNFP